MLGVTLLELMAVVMVIGILGMIALPSYRQYMMRAHRGEAKAFLLQIQTNQERFYLVNRTYGDIAALQAAGYLNNPPRSERGLYAVLLAGPNGVGAPNAVGYTATATAVAGAQIDMTADTRCVTFAIDAQGVRTATGTDAANCW
jgi:type IV pilus assembly protein PilE